ncbi:CHAT domain-containing protein [Penicillium cataractarum]|uniref:CHAT domain-containing protein n=1 Tax=Penicillium cataractarum TaxID=2100454 RepID=A0A9W9S1S9_9EURO|nr:CHAT domain-containing protein [Penicillium cataractarum]KAJ5370325.1 CHAT domain-containing protein [Penicillium cataractarum]
MKEVIRLIANVSPRALSSYDKQTSLEDATAVDGLASMAAAISLDAGDEPQEALQLLEQGHGIIGGGLTELRTEISDLETAHPDLAQKFEHIRNQLDLPEQLGNELDNAPGGVNRRHILQDGLTLTIEEIRGLPVFEGFLCPLTVNQIKSTANIGPLVFVNVGHFFCDAFIVQEEKIGLVPLPDVDVPKTLEMASKLRTDTASVLEWLWNSIANPVLNYLGFLKKPSDEFWPHIWWATTGLMSWFPLHAAGIYSYPSDETVLDPTEVRMLRDLCPDLGLHPVEPVCPTRDSVLEQLKKCKVFHFAGHGIFDLREPSQSCLAVHDWEQNRLTVGDLRDLRLHEEAPFLSYLSACSTSSITKDKLIGEGIHLVNACQLAGFRHAVGTLCEVSDKHCVDVARILYLTLREKGLTDEAVYHGLHRAVRSLRERGLGGGKGPVPPGSESGSVKNSPTTGTSQNLQQAPQQLT